MASHRKMLIEMIDYRRFIGGDSFLASVQWAANFLELVLQEENFSLKMLAFAFLTDFGS
jgi:hypothetical protein